MEIVFSWDTDIDTSPDHRKVIENAVRSDILSQIEDEFAPCHTGTMKVSLRVFGPLRTELAGTVSCSCGNLLCRMSGTSNASKVSYTIPE